MARLGNTFDATGVDPSRSFEILPPGRQLVQIVNSEMRATRDGQGQYLWLEMDVLEGPFAGRKLFDRLNLVNNNPGTVEMAQRTLSAICHATGRMQVQDSEELHLIPMQVDVTVQPPKNGYGESNGIRYLVPDQATVATRPAAPPQANRPAAQPRPAASPSTPPASAPWRRSA